jgi:ubiquinone/menaquinone biosynthesis C-methylase UbiE
MAEPTYKDLEHAGWREKADAYDDWFARITRQAIEPTLDAIAPDANDYAGKRLLDICTGTGHLAAAAARRGAVAEGLDFAEAMVEQARRNYPDLTFTVGDAETLPYEAGSFDIVACAFGHLHFDDADRAIAEAARVLVPGGRYGFTVWCGPGQGAAMFKLIVDAVKAHGTTDVGLPPAPPLFRFADPEESRTTLERLGFRDVESRVIDLSWEAESGAEILEMIYKSIVRTPILFERQTPEARERIHAAIVEGAEQYREGGKLKLGFPAALVTATRA